MLVFPNCKINLGLHVVNKRADGFHNLETVFYPVNWCDALEVLENKGSEEMFKYSQSGIAIEGTPEQNLLYKAWKLIAEEKKLPPITVHLHKNIPMGAGLGGGSSDAAYFINLLNSKFNLGYSGTDRLRLASQLGSDCSFFINSAPVFATGKGDEFSEINISLQDYFILVVYPDQHSNTRDAYGGLSPKQPEHSLLSVLSTPVTQWKDCLVNDFEVSIFKKHPAVKLLKENLYASGALYAGMSGSGSAVFGIFDKEPALDLTPGYRSYLQKPFVKIL